MTKKVFGCSYIDERGESCVDMNYYVCETRAEAEKVYADAYGKENIKEVYDYTHAFTEAQIDMIYATQEELYDWGF